MTFFVLSVSISAGADEAREGSVMINGEALHQNILSLNSDPIQSQSETFQKYLSITLDVFAKYSGNFSAPFGMWCDGNMYDIPADGIRCKFLGQFYLDERIGHGIAFLKVRGYLQLYSLPAELFSANWKYKILEIIRTDISITEPEDRPKPGGGISSAGGKKTDPSKRD